MCYHIGISPFGGLVYSCLQLYFTINLEEIFYFNNKKCRIYATFGVSQTPKIFIYRNENNYEKELKKIYFVHINHYAYHLVKHSCLSQRGVDKRKIKVTDEIAIQMAENFAKGAYTELSLSAANPIKLYESTGKAIGYIVNYYYNSTPYGYVIFDTTGSSLISEYSFGPNAKSPYDIIASSTQSTYSLNNAPLIKTAPFTYGLVDESNGTLTNNYGETESINPSTYSINSDGKDPSSWSDVFWKFKQFMKITILLLPII